MLHKLILLSLLLPFGAHALEVDSYKCVANSSTHAICEIRLKGLVERSDMLFLTNVHDIDRLSFGRTQLGQTGYRYQGRFYARFFPRTYSLQNIVGEVDPILTLEAESLLGPGAGLFQDSVLKVVPAEKEWSLQVKTLWFPTLLFLLTLSAAIAGIWLCTSPAPGDGWLWRDTELRVFYFSTVAALFYNSEWPKLLVPQVLSSEQYINTHTLAWTLLTWSLSQLICESIFSDPSALERIRSRTTWIDEALTYAAGFFLLSGIILGSWHHTYALTVPLAGLGIITLARLWQVRFSRVLRRAHLPGIYLYLFLVAFSALLIGSYAFATDWSQQIFYPINIVAGLCLFAILNRHYHLRQLAADCEDFRQDCRDKLLLVKTGEERVNTITQAIQEHWDGARVSVVSLRGDHGLLLASAGSLALPVTPDLGAKKAGPLVRRVRREKHCLYAPVSEELGRDLADQGLRYSTFAIPVCEGEDVRTVVLFMAHEGERIPPRDALSMHWMGESLKLEIASAVQQMLTEQNLALLEDHMNQRSGLFLEGRDAWDRILPANASEERRVAVHMQLPQFRHNALAEAVRSNPLLFRCRALFEQELLKSWHNIRKQFEFVVHDEGGKLLFVAPKEFRASFLRDVSPESAAFSLSQHLIRAAQQLLQEERFRVLHLELSTVGIWAGKLRSYALEDFCQRVNESHALVLIDESDEKLRFLLEEAPKLQLKLKRAA